MADTAERIELICSNNNSRHQVEPGATLLDVLEQFPLQLPHEPVGAIVNHRLRDLRFRLFLPKTVEFIDATHPAGINIYARSLFCLMQKAVRDLLPGHRLVVDHSVSNGYYCELRGRSEAIDYPLIQRIASHMRELVAADIPFVSRTMLTSEALEIFEKQGDVEKVRFLRSRPRLYTTIYQFADFYDFYLEGLVPSSRYLQVFDLTKYHDGMLLMVPRRDNPNKVEELVLQPKMFTIFQEFKHWQDVLNIEDAGEINELIAREGYSELIRICESMHEKRLAAIADQIAIRPDVRIVLVAGPSSSGKTTFSKRLAVHLKVCGRQPYPIELDNYFVDRDKTPRDATGEYDFEALEALDVQLFNHDLLALMNGERVEMPRYSFTEGKRVYEGKFLELPPNGILIVEGIHGLNPDLVPQIAPERCFKVYTSALTSISLDGLTRIPSTDNRLLRRMVRDAKYRGYSAANTIARWESVRRGEHRNIFPFQEEADVMFNSALPYEFGVLKRDAEILLHEVHSAQPEYREAVRLLRFLEVFTPIPDTEIPPTSLLREFLGGSSFSY